MIRRLCVSALFTGILFANTGRSVQAYEPGFSFAFGYSLGQANQFRNRLPAPPYFAVHPPVYYGERHERPYGESPYASWPMLQANSDYAVRPKQSPVQFVNPHVHSESPCGSCGQPAAGTEPIQQGKMVTIVNPFVVSSDSIASNHDGK
jgi:hypothetical protein